MIEDLLISRTEITFGLDSIVVRKFTNGVLGGLTLDVTNYPQQTVLAGQVVMTDGERYMPLPITDGTYDRLPEGFRYFGVVYRSSRVKYGVSVMTRGSVNKYRAPYDLTSIEEDFKTQCPYIILACDVPEMEEYVRLEASDGVIYTSDGREIWFRSGRKSDSIEGV